MNATNDVMYTQIAGINFRKETAEKNLGSFLGYAEPYPVDADPEAIGCFSTNGELIGFIPRTRKNDFMEFAQEGTNEEGKVLFAGNIKKIIRGGQDQDYFFTANVALVKGPKTKDLLKMYYEEDFDLYGKNNPA